MHLPVIFLFLFKERRTYWKKKKNITEYIEGTYPTVRELIFMKIRFREFWSILRKLVPAKINGNVGDIAKMFHFSLSPRTPLPRSVTSIHYEHIGKIFHFSLSPLPPFLPTKICDWSILDILTKYFIFPRPLPRLCDFDGFWTYQNFSFFPRPCPFPYQALWL